MTPQLLTLNFSTLPSLWLAYPKALFARRPVHVPEGRRATRIEAHIRQLAPNPGHLRDYRRVCGFAENDELPLTYPHVLAMPLHMAMLTSDAFPVRLLGLVHVRNHIRRLEPVAADAALDIDCSLEGHRETERGQEFDLVTEARADGGRAVWSETTTFLARRRAPRQAGGARAPAAPAAAEVSPPQGAVKTTSFHADADIGRRYAGVSGDINPIHLMDVTARLFGFSGAIAHGMWSLARSVAELETPGAVEVSATFKLPIYLPAWVMLESWETAEGRGFALKDSQGDRPHAIGSLVRL